MKLKYTLIFLILNAILASVLFINFSFKSNEKQNLTNKHEASKPKIVPPKIETDNNQIPSQVALSTPSNSLPIVDIKPHISPTCISLGPLGINDKANLDVILSKNENQAIIVKKPVYEIYWNLGNNYQNATSLFEKQKNGPMSDSKFVLIQDEENNWIVSITEVYTTIETAKSLAIQLAEKAQKINAGGKWQYRTKPDAYFYTFNDFLKLNSNTINSINVLFNTQKRTC
jgi:hypothetical protein